MCDETGSVLVAIVGFILFVISAWTPWDTKKLWDKYGDMAVVRKQVRKCKLPILSVLAVIWLAGIVIQSV